VRGAGSDAAGVRCTAAVTTDDPVLQLADRLFAAVSAGDLRTLREEIYAPDCRIWHNGDGIAQTVEQNLTVLGWAVKHIADLRYEEVRRQRTPTGFVQQHVLRGRIANGTELHVPACMVGTVENGRITRLEEYLDMAHLAPVLQSR
jgi:ketosteroid isomerase-like protein